MQTLRSRPSDATLKGPQVEANLKRSLQARIATKRCGTRSRRGSKHHKRPEQHRCPAPGRSGVGPKSQLSVTLVKATQEP